MPFKIQFDGASPIRAKQAEDFEAVQDRGLPLPKGDGIDFESPDELADCL